MVQPEWKFLPLSLSRSLSAPRPAPPLRWDSWSLLRSRRRRRCASTRKLMKIQLKDEGRRVTFLPRRTRKSRRPRQAPRPRRLGGAGPARRGGVDTGRAEEEQEVVPELQQQKRGRVFSSFTNKEEEEAGERSRPSVLSEDRKQQVLLPVHQAVRKTARKVDDCPGIS